MRVRPHPELARRVRTAAHRVVARAERAADDRELRHLRAGDGGHELRAVACDPAGLVLLADHEARDVLEEDERHLALARELDEVRALLRRLREEHAVRGEDPDRVALDPRPAADERLAVERLELVEARPVHDPGDHLARIELGAVVVRNQPVELGRVCNRRLAVQNGPWRRQGYRCAGSRRSGARSRARARPRSRSGRRRPTAARARRRRRAPPPSRPGRSRPSRAAARR